MSEPIAELGGRKWDELEVLEHANGSLLFAAEVRRRDRTGQVKVRKVRFRLPTRDDEFQARVEARKLCKKKELDEKEDRDLFKQIERLALLSFAIRDFDAPHPQFAKLEELATYDEGCLQDIEEQISLRKDEVDPRDAVTTEEEFWRKTLAVARERNIRPLVDIAGRDQNAFVIRLALEACRSPTGLSWLRSFGISIPESSPSPSSSASSEATST